MGTGRKASRLAHQDKAAFALSASSCMQSVRVRPVLQHDTGCHTHDQPLCWH